MTLEDAVDALVWWLRLQPIAFLSAISHKQLGPEHFRFGVAQVEPEPKKRIFDVHPLDISDCYEVKEVEAA